MIERSRVYLFEKLNSIRNLATVHLSSLTLFSSRLLFLVIASMFVAVVKAVATFCFHLISFHINVETNERCEEKN